MSNHFSAAMLKFPADDARLDLTDLFVFASPGRRGKTVLIFDVNPFMTGADFHPDGVYRINVDNDGDAQADAAFTFVFSESNGSGQTGTVYYATGSRARDPEPHGAVLVEGTQADEPVATRSANQRRSRANAAGSHATYAMRRGRSRLTWSTTVRPAPERGGSSTTRSARRRCERRSTWSTFPRSTRTPSRPCRLLLASLTAGGLAHGVPRSHHHARRRRAEGVRVDPARQGARPVWLPPRSS